MSAVDVEGLRGHIIKTATRLRLIEADFADEPDETRRAYLCDEIEQALKVVVPARRNEFLEGLMERFPVAGGRSRPIPEAPSVPCDSVRADKLRDVEFLVQNLVDLAPTLSPEQKELVARSLGLERSPADVEKPHSEESVQKLREVLQVGDGCGMAHDRLIELCTTLADTFVIKLEPLISNTWHDLAPRSSVRPPKGTGDIMSRFVREDRGASREQMDGQLRQVRRLAAAMISATAGVGGQFAKNHLARFSPSAIQALVKVEQGSMFVSQEVRCWRKYLDLASTLSEDSIETELRSIVVAHVESLLKGMGR